MTFPRAFWMWRIDNLILLSDFIYKFYKDELLKKIQKRKNNFFRVAGKRIHLNNFLGGCSSAAFSKDVRRRILPLSFAQLHNYKPPSEKMNKSPYELFN